MSGSTFLEIENKLSGNCDKVSLLMLRTKLQLNASKKNVMSIVTSRRLQIQESFVKVRMDGIELIENEDKVESFIGCQVQSILK